MAKSYSNLGDITVCVCLVNLDRREGRLKTGCGLRARAALGEPQANGQGPQPDRLHIHEYYVWNTMTGILGPITA